MASFLPRQNVSNFCNVHIMVIPGCIPRLINRIIQKLFLPYRTGNEEKANTMTASWGGVGIMWGKNVAYVFIKTMHLSLILSTKYNGAVQITALLSAL